MSGPFKMKGNPMKRNFGIGVSPMREKEEKKTFSTQEEDPNAKNIKKSKKSTTGVGDGAKQSLRDIAHKKEASDARAQRKYIKKNERSVEKETTDDLQKKDYDKLNDTSTEEVTRKDVRKAKKAYKKRKRQSKRRKKIERYESQY